MILQVVPANEGAVSKPASAAINRSERGFPFLALQTGDFYCGSRSGINSPPACQLRIIAGSGGDPVGAVPLALRGCCAALTGDS